MVILVGIFIIPGVLPNSKEEMEFVMKSLFLFTILTVALISGCSPQSRAVTTIPVLTDTNQTKGNTQTATIVKPTIPLTATPQITKVVNRCISISNNQPTSAFSGTVALGDWDKYTLILKSGTEIRIPPEQPTLSNEVIDAHVSPDGKYVMYEQYADQAGNTKLVFRKADGSGSTQFVSDPSWLGYYQWLSDELVRIPILAGQNDIKLLALNPNTKASQSLRVDLPMIADGTEINWMIDDFAIHFGTTRGTNIVYDPSLTRAVYPKEGQAVALYDVENNKELASAQFKDWGSSPQWSSDGKYLSIKATVSSASGQSGDDFFVILRDGPDFTRLTNLADIYPGISLGAYAWSTNGQQLAFWYKTQDTSSADANNPYSLGVVDISSGKVTNTCLSGIGIKTNVVLSPQPNLHSLLVRSAQPVWSPDGTQLLITRLASDQKSYNVILVDLVNKTAYTIAENVDPIGWMTK